MSAAVHYSITYMPQKTVLIVEDEQVLRNLIEKKLTKAGYITLSTGDGDAGLKMALEKHPDLILLDIMMPHNGLEMLSELRKDMVYGNKARVILLTNLSPDSENLISAIEQHEPVFYLVKANYTLEQVLDRVGEAMIKDL